MPHLTANRAARLRRMRYRRPTTDEQLAGALIGASLLCFGLFLAYVILNAGRDVADAGAPYAVALIGLLCVACAIGSAFSFAYSIFPRRIR